MAVSRSLHAVSDEEWVDATRDGLRLAASRGVVAVHDKDGWLGAPRIFQRIADEEGLTLRVWQSVPYERLEELEALTFRSRLGDEHLRIGYLKVFMDGTLGSQTAWMLDGTGVRITSGDELAEIVRRAAAAGWPVGVHAIGDRANREALDAFESTREVWAPLGLRQRIEHAQCLAPEDVGRFAEIGVGCSVQFSHAPSDRDLADRFWPDKAGGAYAFRSLWDSGAVVANGSDAPVEELDPLAGIRAGVLRTIDDRPAWHPDERLTVEQALLASTVNPAWLCGRRAFARQAPSRLSRRSRRPHARSARVPGGRARERAGRGDDGRRPLGAQPAALELTIESETLDRSEGRRVFGKDAEGYHRARPGHPDRVYEILEERCGLGPRRGRARDRLRNRAGNTAACSSAGRRGSSRSSRTRSSPPSS